jgi:hypothetical protein
MAQFKHKKAILKAIFPEGIAIENGIVLTHRLNRYLDTMNSKSETYRYIKLKTEPFLEKDSVLGGNSDEDIILIKDRQLLKLALNIT